MSERGLRETEGEKCGVVVVRSGGKEDRVADRGGHAETLERESVDE